MTTTRRPTTDTLLRVAERTYRATYRVADYDAWSALRVRAGLLALCGMCMTGAVVTPLPCKDCGRHMCAGCHDTIMTCEHACGEHGDDLPRRARVACCPTCAAGE